MKIFLSILALWLLSGCSLGPCGPQLMTRADQEASRLNRPQTHTFRDYIGPTNISLAVWAALGTLLAIYSQSAPTVYCASSALAIIPITISQFEFGILPTVGLIHILAAGLFPLALFAFITRYRRKHKSV